MKIRENFAGKALKKTPKSQQIQGLAHLNSMLVIQDSRDSEGTRKLK